VGQCAGMYSRRVLLLSPSPLPVVNSPPFVGLFAKSMSSAKPREAESNMIITASHSLSQLARAPTVLLNLSLGRGSPR
jgi:hypothetical protein